MAEKKPKTPRKSTRAKKKDPAMDFELLKEKFKEKKSVHYNMSGSFKTDDVIDHDTFGKGVVINSSYEKIDVVFYDKLRTLACDR